jgi:hypothetical protein
MSCNCNNTNSESTAFVCACDNFLFPPVLNIDAGLTDLPRQTATFSQFRKAMLYAIRAEGQPLDGWQARSESDLGVMLIEMWAYVCDVISFYDKVIANEEYLSTATQRDSLRKLVALLGYIPRPATASSVQLAALASGRLPVTLPLGTAFRSGAFGSNPAQIFELTTDTQINPLANSWQVLYPHWQTVQSTDPNNELNIIPKVAPKEKMLLLLTTPNDSNNQVLQVANSQPLVDIDGSKYTNLIFTAALSLPDFSSSPPVPGTSFTSLQLSTPTRTAVVTQITTSNTILLDAVYNDIRQGEYIFITSSWDARWFKVQSVAIQQPPPVNNTITVNPNGAGLQTIAVSSTQGNVTALTLDENVNHDPSRVSNPYPSDNTQQYSINNIALRSYRYYYARYAGDVLASDLFSELSLDNWTNSDQLQLHFGLQNAGTVTGLATGTLTNTNPDPLSLSPVDANSTVVYPTQFLFKDNNARAIALTGQITVNDDTLTLGTNTDWDNITPSPSLVLPVTVYGNLITATRGQTVLNEILGSGDGSSANQTFTLKNSPLTYFSGSASGNNLGVTSTLTIYVNNILWQEVPSFYGALPSDQLYIVRQDDSGNSYITFGDGIRGQRLPTGTNNVTANYRYGAGSACPPAGIVNQISKPVKGLSSVTNPQPAWGGGDADSSATLRTSAPLSALILGRAVSILDMQAVALTVPGVDAAQAEWQWQSTAQCALVQIWYAGQDNLASSICQQISNLSDPSIIIMVNEATGVSANLIIQVEIDPRYLSTVVLPLVNQALVSLLAPANTGIGAPLFRSQIFTTCLSITGVTVVDSITLNGADFSDYALSPGSGAYYDLTTGGIIINGQTFTTSNQTS